MMLNHITHGGAGAAPPLIIAHGLFGSARNWGSVAKALAEDRQVIAVDMRNHGESAHSPDMSYDAMADDLAEIIETMPGAVDILGHSMGGKAVMRLAERGGAAAEQLRRVVVADIAPIPYQHSHLHYITAMQALDPAAYDRRAEADRALAAHVPERMVRGFLLQSLDLPGKKWRLGLAHLAAAMPDIIGYPQDAGRYGGEMLFIRGEMSDYLPDESWPEVERRFPKARLTTIEGAGHWVHAEAPERFIAEMHKELSRGAR